MLSVRVCLAGTILGTALVGACRSRPSVTPAVGVAYPPWAGGFVAVAESTLRAAWGDSALVPRFVLDTQRGPERIERTVQWTQELLRSPGVSIVVGPSTSDAALAVAPMINSAAIPEIIPNATSRRLDQAGPWVFRLVGNDSAEGAFLVHQILARPGLRRVLILYVNDEYGQGLRAGIHDALDHAGLAPTAELPVGGDSDFDLLLRNEFTQRRPDVVVCAVRNPEFAKAAAALLRLRSRVPVFVGDGAFGPAALRSAVGRVPFEVYGATLWFRTGLEPAAQAYVERFHRMLHQWPRGEDAVIHDALTLAATARREGQDDPRRIRLWLLSLGVTRPPFPGVAGPIDFRSDHPRPFRLGRFVADSAVDAEIR